MSNLAENKLSDNPPAPESGVSRAENRSANVSLETGTVIGLKARILTVRVGDVQMSATRATSCLVAPIEGDHVLVAMPPGECYVLAVLRREEGAACTIVAEGDLELSAPSGKVVVSSGEGIDLLSAKETSLISPRLSMHASDVTAVFDRLSYMGAALRAEVQKIRTVAVEVDNFFERTLSRVKRSYKFVEEMEQVHAKQIDMQAETSIRMHSESTVLTAEGLCKLDGSQIHIG